MPKWEYMTLRAYQGEIVQLNGQDPGQAGKKRPQFPEYLNVLGREGWQVDTYLLDRPDDRGHAAFEILLRREVNTP